MEKGKRVNWAGEGHGYDLYIVSLIDGLTNLFDPSRSFIARWGKDSL